MTKSVTADSGLDRSLTEKRKQYNSVGDFVYALFEERRNNGGLTVAGMIEIADSLKGIYSPHDAGNGNCRDYREALKIITYHMRESMGLPQLMEEPDPPYVPMDLLESMLKRHNHNSNGSAPKTATSGVTYGAAPQTPEQSTDKKRISRTIRNSGITSYRQGPPLSEFEETEASRRKVDRAHKATRHILERESATA